MDSRFRIGMRGRELMGGVGKTMMQSGGTFGTFMAIGMGIRCWGRTLKPPSLLFIPVSSLSETPQSYGTLPKTITRRLFTVTLSNCSLVLSINAQSYPTVRVSGGFSLHIKSDLFVALMWSKGFYTDLVAQWRRSRPEGWRYLGSLYQTTGVWSYGSCLSEKHKGEKSV